METLHIFCSEIIHLEVGTYMALLNDIPRLMHFPYVISKKDKQKLWSKDDKYVWTLP